LDWKKPPFVLLENVDRLLNSPGNQRGRDFAIILSCLATLGYQVEWRVVNAADYGFPQRRRRVFIFAQLAKKARRESPTRVLFSEGVLARAFPVQAPFELPLQGNFIVPFGIPKTPQLATKNFGVGQKTTAFRNAGVMQAWDVWTDDVEPHHHAVPREEEPHTLGDVVSRTDPKAVPEDYFIPESQLEKWKYLKGAKNEKRTHKGSKAEYFYTEGALPFPDPLERPARTILTAEGGTSASRFKHVVRTADGRLRRLIPEELEELNGFPRGWTQGMGDLKRAFCMGNALVVGVVRRIAEEIRKEAEAGTSKRALTVANK
jgi:DNA (cytosine-5)-methyltransferase 1